jgi:hypothetical protein
MSVFPKNYICCFVVANGYAKITLFLWNKYQFGGGGGGENVNVYHKKKKPNKKKKKN